MARPGRIRPRRSLVGRLLLGAVSFGVVAVAGSNMAAGQGQSQPIPASFCPEMTDSIRRLHLVLLGTEPGREEFEAQVTAYKTGTRALPQLAADLLLSDEFLSRSITSDEAFIQFVVGQSLGRDPDSEELSYWTSALAGGYDRALVVLSYTESAEFVQASGTATPLSGLLHWYPEGTQWRCNVGSTTIRDPLTPLGDQIHADYLTRNSGSTSDTLHIATTNENGSINTTMVRNRLAAGYTDIVWDGSFNGNGSYGNGLLVDAGASTSSPFP